MRQTASNENASLPSRHPPRFQTTSSQIQHGCYQLRLSPASMANVTGVITGAGKSLRPFVAMFSMAHTFLGNVKINQTISTSAEI